MIRRDTFMGQTFVSQDGATEQDVINNASFGSVGYSGGNELNINMRPVMSNGQPVPMPGEPGFAQVNGLPNNWQQMLPGNTGKIGMVASNMPFHQTPPQVYNGYTGFAPGYNQQMTSPSYYGNRPYGAPVNPFANVGQQEQKPTRILVTPPNGARSGEYIFSSGTQEKIVELYRTYARKIEDEMYEHELQTAQMYGGSYGGSWGGNSWGYGQTNWFGFNNQYDCPSNRALKEEIEKIYEEARENKINLYKNLSRLAHKNIGKPLDEEQLDTLYRGYWTDNVSEGAVRVTKTKRMEFSIESGNRRITVINGSTTDYIQEVNNKASTYNRMVPFDNSGFYREIVRHQREEIRKFIPENATDEEFANGLEEYRQYQRRQEFKHQLELAKVDPKSNDATVKFLAKKKRIKALLERYGTKIDVSRIPLHMYACVKGDQEIEELLQKAQRRQEMGLGFADIHKMSFAEATQLRTKQVPENVVVQTSFPLAEAERKMDQMGNIGAEMPFKRFDTMEQVFHGNNPNVQAQVPQDDIILPKLDDGDLSDEEARAVAQSMMTEAVANYMETTSRQDDEDYTDDPRFRELLLRQQAMCIDNPEAAAEARRQMDRLKAEIDVKKSIDLCSSDPFLRGGGGDSS